MTYMSWTTNLSVNVEEIDLQHQKLVSFIDELNFTMRKRKAKEVLSDILAGLFEYTQKHFSTEEKYFDKFGYPKASSHKEEHKKFLQKALEFKKEFDEGNELVSIPLLFFLRDWLVRHINNSDKKYSAFFNANGLH